MRARFSVAVVTAVVVAAAPLVVLHLVAGPVVSVPPVGQVQAWLHQPLTSGFLTMVLQAAAWVLWALLSAFVTHRARRHLAARVRWRFAVRLPGPVQGLAAAVLGASAVTSAALPVAAHAAPVTDTYPDAAPTEGTTEAQQDKGRAVSVATRAVTATAAQSDRASTDGDLASDGTASLTGATTDGFRAADASRTAWPAATRWSGASEQGDICVVRRGDTLSAIAEQRLGDADRWPEIWALNRGRHFAIVGGTFTNPHLIHPGWTLALPQDAVPPTTPQPSKSDVDSPAPGPSEPGEPTAVPSPPADTPGDGAVDSGSTAPSPPAPSVSEPPAISPSSPGSRSGPTGEGITVGNGSWVDLGLAAAITAAAALVWALRRRRYRPQLPGQQRRGDGDLAPLPAVVTHIRRGLRRRHTADDVDILGTDSPSADLTDDRSISSGGVDRPASAGTVGESIREEDLAGGRGPVVPGRDNAVAAAWPPAGLGLTGPGAPAAVRGFLTAALATTAVHGRGTVVICATTAAALLETSVLPESPRLTVTDGLAAALDLCETQALHRTRLLYQHEVDTVADLPDAGHEEPVPPVLLIADAAARHERARVAALLAQGNRLDIHGVLLGRWPEGDTLVVDTDGTTTADGTSRHATGPADLGRLTVLTPTETVDLVTTLAETHTGQPPSTRSVDLPAAPKPPPGPRADGTAEAVPDDGHACTVAAGSAYSAPEGAEFPSGRQAVAPSGHSYQPDTTQSGGLVAVRTLGTARIVEMDTTIPLRAKALELLVYLVVHDGDATQDAILDDLLPDAPRSKAPHRLHTYVSALRKTLTRTGGPGSYLIHPARRYALARDLMDVDLWRMRDALRVAHRATAPDTRLAALRTAVDAYGGALADGFDYEWIEVHREEIRRQALDAHLALAAATGDPAEAVTVLQAAIRHAPYAEPVYQQAMRAHAALGHLDEVRALRETLIHRLDDIDATPSKDTLDLADQLTTDPATGPGHARPRDAGRHS